MIPRQGPRSETLPPLKIYKEDVEKLVSLFRNHCQNVTFGNLENIYSSLEEMEQNNSDRLKCLFISGQVPHAELFIRGVYTVPQAPFKNIIFTSERTDSSNLLYLSVKDYLQTRKWIAKIIVRNSAIVIGASLLIACFFLKWILRAQTLRNELIYDAVGLTSIALFGVAVFMSTREVSYISLRRRAKLESFWVRNRERMLVGFGAGIFGILLTLVTEWLKNRLLK